MAPLGRSSTFGTYDIKNIDVSLCSATEDVTNGLCGAVVSFGNASSGTFADSVVHDCVAQHGPVFYASQGGAGILSVCPHIT